MSERGRSLVRRAVVYGLANAMSAGETFSSAATEVAQGAERVASSAGGLAGDLVGEAQQARHSANVKGSNSQTRARPSRTTQARTAGAKR
jgi:hypothetical protein